VLSGEAKNTNSIVFCSTRSELEPKIYHTWGEHANHYTTNAVLFLRMILSSEFNFALILDFLTLQYTNNVLGKYNYPLTICSHHWHNGTAPTSLYLTYQIFNIIHDFNCRRICIYLMAMKIQSSCKNMTYCILWQRRSCIYAVTPWRAHQQVKKKLYCYFYYRLISIINISLIRRTSNVNI
jgi:hypothetical protein